MGGSITRGMRSAVGWISAKPYRLVLATVFCAHNLAPVAGALLIVDTLRRGLSPGVVSGALATLGTVALGFALTTPMSIVLGFVVPLLIGGVISGGLLGWSRSLSFTFQALSIGLVGGTLIVFTLVPNADRIGEILQTDIVELLQASGVSPDLVGQFAATDAGELIRVLLISLQLCLLGALMLGLWWYALIAEGLSFGAEFRALKLGRSVGIALMLLVVAAQVLDARAIAYVAPLAVIGFLFQGLAVLHARSRSDKWPKVIVVVVYVALFSLSPLTVVVLMGLSAVGLLDNFFELRTRAVPDE